MRDGWLSGLAGRRQEGSREGITSICSAHPVVIETALRRAGDAPVLIEATCNQVNQEGGYTGMTPAAFRSFVAGIAQGVGYDPAGLVLGGDHLGPNPWRALPATAAMDRAEAMVAAYVAAGFAKIHLDTSMPCADDAASLGDELVAERAARLAVIAENTARSAGVPPPVYVIGTEVPPPGGMMAAHAIAVTRPEAARATLAAHRRAFAQAGIPGASDRILALVVQPGVEFGQETIVAYNPTTAESLSRLLVAEPSLVFEAHSTDYQPREKLAALVRDGFAILKVGPALTFALREALYALDRIAAELDPAWQESTLEASMERLMLAEPEHWRGYVDGGATKQRILRHYGFSDRIRYYWPAPEARAAVELLLAQFTQPIPLTLMSQFLPRSFAAVRDGRVAPEPGPLVRHHIGQVLDDYAFAASASGGRRAA